jgi:DNA-binding NarL/FixJ family response regulator
LRRRVRAHRKSVGNRIRSRSGRDETVAVTVLIVDDHPSFRASARTLLESEGFEVVGEAENGETAVHTARKLQPDLVLLDVQLPGMNGFAVADELRKLEDPPVVILTSSRDGADYGRCIGECGAHGFVPKADLSGAAIAAFFAA